jgi:hypothetical protein
VTRKFERGECLEESLIASDQRLFLLERLTAVAQRLGAAPHAPAQPGPGSKRVHVGQHRRGGTRR